MRLENFVTSREIDPKYLFLLYACHDCVWEIRSRKPSPSIRVLGMFPGKDRLISTNFAERSALGGWQSRAWNADARSGCYLALAIWIVPAIETNVHDVVTGAIDGTYFKHMG